MNIEAHQYLKKGVEQSHENPGWIAKREPTNDTPKRGCVNETPERGQEN